MDTACLMTTKTRQPTCLDCVFHASPAELGDRFHLCTLPPDCAPPAAREPDDAWRDRDEGWTYLGTSCHVMRRRGAVCGPDAAMWRRANAPASPASDNVSGDAA